MSRNWLDSSKNSNLFIQSYVQGFVDISGGSLLLRNNNLLIAGGDASLNGRVYVTGDVSVNSRLFISGDTSLNGRLFVTGDASFNGNVKASLIYIGGALVSPTSVISDVYNNTRLGTNALQNTTTGSNNTGAGYNSGTTNITGSNNTFLGANTNVSTTSTTQSTAVGYNSQITANNQIVLGTATEKNIFIGDVSINGNLFAVSDVSFGGNLTTTGNITVSTGTTLSVTGGTVGIGGGGISTTTSNVQSTNTATYGQTWTTVPSISTSAAYSSVALSSTGQYMLCASGNRVFVSNNYGTNFTNSLNIAAINQAIYSSTGTLYGQSMTAYSMYTLADVPSGALGGNTGGVAVDSYGVYITDATNSAVKFLSKSNQYIFGITMSQNYLYTIASTGYASQGLFTDSFGVYIMDSSNFRVQYLSRIAQNAWSFSMLANNIYTIAGNGTQSTSVNGQLAISSPLTYSRGIFVDSTGLYIANSNSHMVLFVPRINQYIWGSSMSANYIYIIAGNGTAGTGTSTLATNSSVLNQPFSVFSDSYGVYIAEFNNNRVQFLSRTNQYLFGYSMVANFIYVVAGNGTAGLGTNTSATGSAVLKFPLGVYSDSYGVYITDGDTSGRVQFVSRTDQYFFNSSMSANYIYTVTSSLSRPQQICSDSVGIYIADNSNQRAQFIPFIFYTAYLVTQPISSISISSTGQYQVATVNGGPTYLSTNYGTTYNSISIAGITSAAFSAVAISSTGQYQIVATSPGSIYVSNNYGNTFTRNTNGPTTTGAYSGVSISSTGQYMIASTNPGASYLSSNYGDSFVAVTSLSTSAYTSVSMSSTGQYMLACTDKLSITSTVSSQPSITSGTSPTTTSYGSYTILTFTTVGSTTITFSDYVKIGYIVVGGGGGSQYYGVGAGGGGVSWSPVASGLIGSSFTITVGAGGYGGPGTSTGTQQPGGASSITGGQVNIISNGGSANFWAGDTNPGALGGTTNGLATNYSSGGNGGGGFTVPQTGFAGPLVSIPDINMSTNYGGGGGGLSSTTNQVLAGGAGGGGAGGYGQPVAGSPNTGGGAGGGSGPGALTLVNVNGGSGIVKIYFQLPSTITATLPGYTYLSNNYGLTFTPNPVVATSGIYKSVSVSSTGQHMIANTTSAGYFSNNYGSSFSTYLTLTSTVSSMATAISSTGKYMIAAANPGAVYLSSPPLVSTITTNLNGMLTLTDLSMNGNLYTPTLISTIVAQPTTTLTNVGATFTANPIGLLTSANYYLVAMSSTGQYMLAAVFGGSVYLSTNYGSSFTANPSGLLTSASFIALAISSTGQYMLTGADNGSVYISTNYGSSFTANPIGLISPTYYRSLAISSTGQYMLAGVFTDGSVYLSTNYGTSFTANPRGLLTAAKYRGLAISSTGQYMLAGVSGASVYLSTNYGSSFTANPSGLLTSASYISTSISSTGQYMLACVSGGSVYLSTNYGSSFTANPSGLLTAANYRLVAISSTGQYMLASVSVSVYLSSNYGSSFTANPSGLLTSASYYGVAISSTGQYMLTCVVGGSVYLSKATMTQSTNTYPFTNIKGYVGFTDASGSSTGADAKALVEINGVGNLTQTYQNTVYTDNYSLYTSGSVLIGQNLNVASDSRIKTNIQDVVDVSALSVIRQLKPKRYTYIDTKNRGVQPVWGYIAQEVKEIVDYAVNETTDYVPNIYYDVTINGNVLILPPKTYMVTHYDESGNPLPETEYTDPTIPTTDNFTSNQDSTTPIQIKLIDTESGKVIITTIVTIQDERTIVVTDDLSQYQTLFLYGQRVTDFYVLDKNAVFTIATAALQEVDLELQEAKAQVQELANDLALIRGTYGSSMT